MKNLAKAGQAGSTKASPGALLHGQREHLTGGLPAIGSARDLCGQLEASSHCRDLGFRWISWFLPSFSYKKHDKSLLISHEIALEAPPYLPFSAYIS